MIKQVVHIDRNYPRKFNGVDAGQYSNANWSFDTHAETTIDGNVEQPSLYSVSANHVNSDDSNPDQLFDNRQATPTQYANLAGDQPANENQIRFNANVFNYIVHTSIENVVLKYDAPVAYAEGRENKLTGEFEWKEKYFVLDGYSYHILFDILIHDPMGVDVHCSEGYIGNVLFHQRTRKNDTPSDTTPVENISYAKYLTDKWNAESGTIPTDGKFITMHGKQTEYDHYKFEKLPDAYSDGSTTEPAYKISIQLGGMGYTTDDINTSTEHYEAWLTALEKFRTKEIDEQELLKAWEDCEGVKFKFFDVAGNITYWVMPYIEIVVVTLEDLYNMKKLILEFINTKPEDLQLGTDLIGRTTIKVTNPNDKLSDCTILIRLDKESLGELYSRTRKETYITYDGRRIAKIATEDVGNIDDSGWVIAHAMIDIEDFIDELNFARIMVRNLLRADGSLGEWIKECSDNTRKITLDPFIPQFLKETTDKGSAYYKFAKFTEHYLNTMFKAYDKNCYISVLEAIARIGNFNDCTTIYKNLIDKYDDDHGDMLHINSDELLLLIDTEKQDVEDET